MLNKLGLMLFLGIVFAMIAAGCRGYVEDQAVGTEPLYSVKTLLKMDPAKVTAIRLVFGDGTRMVLEEDEVEPVMRRVASLQARRIAGSESAGSLFYMDLVQGDREIRFAADFEADGLDYAVLDPGRTELNEYLVAIGREHNPELLPGIK